MNYFWLVTLRKVHTSNVLIGFGKVIDPMWSLGKGSMKLLNTYYLNLHTLLECYRICLLNVIGEGSQLNGLLFCLKLSNLNGQKLSFIVRLLFATTVYKLWLERSARIYYPDQSWIPDRISVVEILNLVKCKLHSSQLFQSFLLVPVTILKSVNALTLFVCSCYCSNHIIGSAIDVYAIVYSWVCPLPL